MALANTAIMAGTTALSIGSTAQDFENQANASLYNVTSALRLRNTQRTIFEDQYNQINQALGLQLTQNDIEVLGAESRLRAASAETGTSGGTSELAVAESYVVGARTRLALTEDSRSTKLDLARRNIMSRLDSDNRVQSHINDMPSSSMITSTIIAEGIRGFGTGYNISNSYNEYMKNRPEKEEKSKYGDLSSFRLTGGYN